jgi:hypothetical protein
VKANSDMALTDALVDGGVIDNEFVADVLAIDFTTPFFSRSRCGLLKLVPTEGGPTFKARFQAALKASQDRPPRRCWRILRIQNGVPNFIASR